MREPSLNDLTPREREVLHWMAEGKTIWETSKILDISPATVKKHRGGIYRVLGVENLASAINFYRQAVARLAAEKDLRHLSLCPVCLEQLVGASEQQLSEI